MRIRQNSVTIISACILIFIAVLFRFFLISHNWPVTNADEATMALEALHIAYRGEHPIFFYGQDYMGTIQAYLGAILMHLFGDTVFSLRLGTLLIFTLYSICTYYLVSLLYTPTFALFCVTLLSLGSDRMIGLPLIANGGYAETMLFAVLIFLLVSWLVMDQGVIHHAPTHYHRRRLIVYALLGYTVGLALWSDQLILPVIFTGACLLRVYCRQEVRGWNAGALVIGLFIGAIPLIIYNLTAPFMQNSLFVLVGQVFSSAPRVIPLWQQLVQVVMISLPLATGMPFTTGTPTFCGTAEPYQHALSSISALFPSSQAGACLAIHGGWSALLIALWLVALLTTISVIRQQQMLSSLALKPDVRTEQTKHAARLMILCSAALWFMLFAISVTAATTPRASSRYLVCMLIALPAILWPLWQWTQQWREQRAVVGTDSSRPRVPLHPTESIPARGRDESVPTTVARIIVCILLLFVFATTYIIGTVQIFHELPDAQHTYMQQQALIDYLLQHGETRIYSTYNTCNILIFQSHEQIICSVLDDMLHTGWNRYPPYYAMVRAAPHVGYVFTVGSTAAQTLMRRVGSNQLSVVHGYVVCACDHGANGFLTLSRNGFSAG